MRRQALVTGASRGIGRAIALDLAQRGWNVALLARDATALDAVAVQCRSLDAEGHYVTYAADIRDTTTFGHALADLGPLDLFVSNHGILDGREQHAIVESGETAARVLEVNLMASVQCLHLVMERMRAQGRGQIGIVASLAGLAPLADAPAYSASKAGLVSYALALREALRAEGIGVSVVCPGYVATDMGALHKGHRPHEIDPADAARRIVRSVLANRRLTGFPAPLWPMALLSVLVPEGVNRFFTRRLRFFVAEDG